MGDKSKKTNQNIVYNEKYSKYDANLKPYPTSIGSQKFEPLSVDRSDVVKADKYFNSRLLEIKKEYEELLEEYSWTKLIYESEYSFQPIVGDEYFLYEKNNGVFFLSLIPPQGWDKKFVGTFKLYNNGKWKKIT